MLQKKLLTASLLYVFYMSFILFYLYPNVSEYNECSCTLCSPLHRYFGQLLNTKNSTQQTMYRQGAISLSVFKLEKH